MINKIMLWCGIFLCCASCASCATENRAASSTIKAGVESEVAGETVDTTCSYFYFTWGKYAEAEGKLEDALEAYEKALVCDAGNVYLMRSVAVLLVRMERKQQAAAWLDKIIANHPEDIDALSFMANLYASMGKVERAAELHQRVLAIDPKDTSTMLMLGTMHARNRDYEQARKVLEELVRIDEHSYPGYLYLARLYQELHFFERALQAYDQALALNWSEPLAYEVAELAEKMKRFDTAIQLYQRVLEGNGADERARLGLAGIYLHRNESDLALQELRQLRKHAADPRKIELTMARILVGQKKYEEAITLFKGLLEDDPELQTARYLLALVYHEKGEPEAARRELVTITPEAEVYEEAAMLLVTILEAEKNWQEAEQLLKARLAAEDQRRPSFYMMLASFYQKQGEVRKGKAVFQEGLEVYPDHSELLFQYGLFLERTGASDAALARMQQVLELDPQNPYALNFVGYTWADAGQNLDQALEYIEQAVALKPHDGFVRDSLGWVYFKRGDTDRAILELQRALDLEPQDPNIHEHLGDAYLKVNELDQALEAYQRAVQLYEGKKEREQVEGKIKNLQK